MGSWFYLSKRGLRFAGFGQKSLSATAKHTYALGTQLRIHEGLRNQDQNGITQIEKTLNVQRAITSLFCRHKKSVPKDAFFMASDANGISALFSTPITAGQKMVGVRGFELLTSCSQSRRATGLRYTPV